MWQLCAAKRLSLPLCFIERGCWWKERAGFPSRAGGLHTLSAKPAGSPSPWLHGPTRRERKRGRVHQCGHRHVGQPNGNFLLVKKTLITCFTHTLRSAAVFWDSFSAQNPKIHTLKATKIAVFNYSLKVLSELMKLLGGECRCMMALIVHKRK